jgi:hypothetical protein
MRKIPIPWTGDGTHHDVNKEGTCVSPFLAQKPFMISLFLLEIESELENKEPATTAKRTSVNEFLSGCLVDAKQMP